MADLTAKWFQAVAKGYTKVIEMNIDKYAHTQDELGETALMKAARMGNRELAEILAPHESGDTNIKMETALMIAAASQSAEIVRLLAELEPCCRLKDGCTALMIATMSSNVEAVKILVNLEGASAP